MTLVRNHNNIVKSVQNNVFMMYVFFEKKTVNALQRYTILNVKRLVFKNPVRIIKKFLLSLSLKISYYKIINNNILIFY